MRGYATFPNCDTCGRFVKPSGPGVSWCQTYTFMTLNDPTYRCDACTEKLGVKDSNCNPSAGPWNGRNPRLETVGGEK